MRAMGADGAWGRRAAGLRVTTTARPAWTRRRPSPTRRRCCTISTIRCSASSTSRRRRRRALLRLCAARRSRRRRRLRRPPSFQRTCARGSPQPLSGASATRPTQSGARSPTVAALPATADAATQWSAREASQAAEPLVVRSRRHRRRQSHRQCRRRRRSSSTITRSTIRQSPTRGCTTRAHGRRRPSARHTRWGHPR